MRTLEIRGLKAAIGEKPILQGIDLTIRTGEIHALMGPNGSGKSTLANVLLGHPSYTVTGGEVLLDGRDFLALDTFERARAGVFLAFQYPVEVPGVTVGKFLKRAAELRLPEGARQDVTGFIRENAVMRFWRWTRPSSTAPESGIFRRGEEAPEIVQMLLLKPAFAILDETDSGLDIDALQLVAKGVNRLRGEGFAGMVITHYQRILNHLRPDRGHVLYQGRIVASGEAELVEELERKGYDWLKEEEHEPAATR
jgi:Fe-S cluster assembly ATP-binding protein